MYWAMYSKALLCLCLVFITDCVFGQYTDPHCDGKQVIVELFEWKWVDVAQECERFLSKKGFCGVQVSPPNEHVMVTRDYPRPWWERYQPVSYKLTSRSGTEEEFIDMVRRCTEVGVRIYVDAVINNMARLGSSGTGTAGSWFDADKLEFPGVPYYYDDFTPRSRCSSADGDIGNNYTDVDVIRNCFLVLLTDLDQSQENVRNRIAEYFNHLIDIGVAGFRIDAAKHIWPQDIAAIQNKVKNLPEGGRPFFYHEVSDLHDDPVKTTEYIPLGYVTEFRYCENIARGIRDFSELDNIVDYMTNSSNALVFVDNHDTQRMPNNVNKPITYQTPREYKMATAFTLANDYGLTRVMSSYDFGRDSSIGPPHNNDFTTKNVAIFSNGSCGDGWICEHRWEVITNMVAFRNAVQGTDKKHWRNVNDEVSFARGNVGFFAMAKEGIMNETLDTGLPEGEYCDLITDCSRRIIVNGSGMATIVINSFENPVLAFIVGIQNGLTGGGDSNNTTPNYGITVSTSTSESTSFSTTMTHTTATTTIHPTKTTITTTASPWKRTVVFLEKGTHVGENVFFEGGLHHSSSNSCPRIAANNPCAIPIRHPSYNQVEGFRAWSVNDNYLDWYGAEPSQGQYQGKEAKGTPGLWTTNQRDNPSYNELNKFGPHYWMMDVEMDCSKTNNGWFEFKGILSDFNHWEANIHNDNYCSGSAGGTPPDKSTNHWARCGFLNVFHWETGSCQINYI